MSMQPLQILVFTFVTTLALAGCNSYSEGGLVGDEQLATKCPANGCADQAANQAQLYLKSAVTSVDTSNLEARVDVGGDCHASTFPSNVINASLLSGSTPLGVRIMSGNYDAAIRCNKGRFNVSVDTAGLGVNANYTLRLELVATDAQGVQYRNASQGVLNLTIRKAQK